MWTVDDVARLIKFKKKNSYLFVCFLSSVACGPFLYMSHVAWGTGDYAEVGVRRLCGSLSNYFGHFMCFAVVAATEIVSCVCGWPRASPGFW